MATYENILDLLENLVDRTEDDIILWKRTPGQTVEFYFAAEYKGYEFDIVSTPHDGVKLRITYDQALVYMASTLQASLSSEMRDLVCRLWCEVRGKDNHKEFRIAELARLLSM